MRFETLKKSAEFKRVRGGVRVATPYFIIEGRPRAEVPVAVSLAPAACRDGEAEPPMAEPTQEQVRIGFTITRKVGSAVVRNRIRRRLKEALRQLEAGVADSGFDYVVVASQATRDYPFDELLEALRSAFARLAAQAAEGGRRSGRRIGGSGRRRGSGKA